MPCRRSFPLLSALLALASTCASAQACAALIPYRALTWSDFRVYEGGDPLIAAHTQSRIVYQYTARVSGRNGSYTATVASLSFDSGFDPAGSWRRSQFAGDPDRLLSHEQGHLDINELHAAALRALKPKQIPVGKGPSPTTALQDLDGKIHDLAEAQITASQKEQDQYDRETDHGRVPDKQDEWNERLARRTKSAGLR